MRIRSLVLICFLVLLLSPNLKVNADTIKGETPLGGFSKALNDFYDRGGSFYTDEELELMANVIYHENGDASEYVQKLTGSVVLNRVRCEWYPNSIKEVLYQHNQYATTGKFFTTKIPEGVYKIARHLLIGGSIAPKKVVFQSRFPQGSGIYYEEKGEIFSIW